MPVIKQKSALEIQQETNIRTIEKIIDEIKLINAKDSFFMRYHEKEKQAGKFRNIVTLFGKALIAAEKNVTTLNIEESCYVQLANSLKTIVLISPENRLKAVDLFNKKIESLNSDYVAANSFLTAENLKIAILAALLITLFVGSFTLGCVCLFHPALVAAIGIGVAAAISYGLTAILAIPIGAVAAWLISSENQQDKGRIVKHGANIARFFKVEPVVDEVPNGLKNPKEELFAGRSNQSAGKTTQTLLLES